MSVERLDGSFRGAVCSRAEDTGIKALNLFNILAVDSRHESLQNVGCLKGCEFHEDAEFYWYEDRLLLVCNFVECAIAVLSNRIKFRLEALMKADKMVLNIPVVASIKPPSVFCKKKKKLISEVEVVLRSLNLSFWDAE